MGLWEDVKKNLTDWYEVTSDKTSEVARTTSLRYDKFAIGRDIERQFGELGSYVYAGMRAGRQDVLMDPALHAMLDRIDALEKELQVKDEQIAAVKARYNSEASAGPAAGQGHGAPDPAKDPEAGA